MKKIAILASGKGTNAKNIHDFFANGNRIKVELVIYDRRNAEVAGLMRDAGADTLYLPAEVWTERPAEIVELLRQRGIDIVVLAGFLRILPPELTRAFAGRILNIHPSLLPAYGGKGMYGHRVHEAVIEAGERYSGATVHLVDDTIDGGEIILQESLELNSGETPESLEQRIRELEFSLYPRAIMALAARQGTDKSDQSDRSDSSRPSDPGQAWANALGIEYDPTKLPPEYPGAVPPPYGNRAAGGAAEAPSGIHRAAMNPAPGNPVSPAVTEEKMPPSYLVWAVVMTVLCCLPAGIVAIIFSTQVSSKFYAGDIEGARRASERAQIWIIVSFVLGVLSNTLYLPVMLLFN